MAHTVDIAQGTPLNPLFALPQPLDLSIGQGEQIAIIGHNASGKTRIAQIIATHIPLKPGQATYHFPTSPYKLTSENIKYISFRDSYGTADATYYYQQRWNQHDIDPYTPTVAEFLEQAIHNAQTAGYGLDAEAALQAETLRNRIRQLLYDTLDLPQLMDRYIISLSSGELRRLQLAKALLPAPHMLIIDNPYVGLDAPTRQQLSWLLHTLTTQYPLQVVLLLNTGEPIPEFITHVYPIQALNLLPKATHAEYISHHPATAATGTYGHVEPFMRTLPQQPAPCTATAPTIVRLCNVSIRYGTRTILGPVDWEIKEGEKWALSGRNGSGKSTLLSLLCADNPQAYACHIELFGQRVGTGQSIWQIKQHIGYVSPEMHRAYNRDMPAIHIVASGLHDTIGLYRPTTARQQADCMAWMELFGIGHLAQRSFTTLSHSQQRLCLLARAFVKDPRLLILDEPLHALDHQNSQLAIQVITAFCQRPGKTLIMVTHHPEELPSIITNRLTL